MALFSRLFRRPKETPAAVFDAPARPDRLLYAVGDIHGRDDLLGRIVEKIRADADGRPHDLVFVGDYIDRGDGSAAVLEHLREMEEGGDNVICLLGNHERMMLDFLDNPAASGRHWLRNGGLQTLASFKVGGVTENSDEAAMTAARDKLRKALGKTEKWLRNRPRSFRSGNMLVVHAAADPRLPVDAQEEKTLLWGHPAFRAEPRQDGIWVIHGHTIVDLPEPVQGRIGIDTGAYATGRLTAVAVDQGDVRFLAG